MLIWTGRRARAICSPITPIEAFPGGSEQFPRELFAFLHGCDVAVYETTARLPMIR